MSTLTVKHKNAIVAFKNADEKGKLLLENLFGKEELFPDIKSRINSFEDALEIDGESDSDVLMLINYSGTNIDMISASNYMKAVILIRVYNEGWVADFTDDNQPKYEVYFKHKSGFGLAYGAYDCWCAGTHCGCRLCFKTSALAEYVTKKHAEIFRDFLTINK